MIESSMPKTEILADAQPADRVFLIDSMSHIYRAFFAPMNARAEPLRNSKGQVTSCAKNSTMRSLRGSVPVVSVSKAMKRMLGNSQHVYPRHVCICLCV